MAIKGPIEEDLEVFIDTDNTFQFAIEDNDGDPVDVTGWSANLEVAASASFTQNKLVIAATVVTDPENPSRTVLEVLITDDDLQFGQLLTEWPVTSKTKSYPYSLKRTNDGFEKELRIGLFNVRRARV